MLKILFVLLLALSAIADTYIVQSNVSTVSFSINKFLFVSVEGKFTKFKGKIIFDDSVTSITGTVDAESLKTDDEKRDKELISAGYFDITQHQYIDFKAISIGENELEASITIKGITQKVSFNIDEIKSTGTKLTLKISSLLNREAFMLNGSFSSLISNDVLVTATLISYIQ